MIDAAMTWTEERVELLKRLWADGRSASQIAAEIGGCSRNAVIGKVHRLGLSGRAKAGPTGEPKPRKLERPAGRAGSGAGRCGAGSGSVAADARARGGARARPATSPFPPRSG